MKFKISDKVRIKTACSGTKVGEIIILFGESESRLSGGGLWAGNCNCSHKWEKININFKIGDKVECITDYLEIKIGIKGVIRHLIVGGTPPIGVEWERNIIKGHNLSGTIKNNRGYYVYPLNIESISNFDRELFILARKVIKEIQ